MLNENISIKQERWAEYLFWYNFQIVFQPGKKKTELDVPVIWSRNFPSYQNEHYCSHSISN